MLWNAPKEKMPKPEAMVAILTAADILNACARASGDRVLMEAVLWWLDVDEGRRY